MQKIRPAQVRSVRPQGSPTTVALCVIFRDNVDTLPALLASVAGHFDEYVFTDTGSADGSRALVSRFLQTHNGRISHFAWVDDFALARQFNFEQAKSVWRMFLDSDDVLVNGQKVRVMAQRLAQEHPSIQGVFIPYDYDVDESLGTMRLCKWGAPAPGGRWRWVDAIHERLEFVGPGLGQENFAKTGDISVRHKRKTTLEKRAAIQRNARIAERIYPSATGQYKARLARTIAMELKLDDKSMEAIPLLSEVYTAYPNFPEGRQAAADICKAYIVNKDLDLALEWGRKAGPSYEAMAHHTRHEWEKTIERQTRGQVIEQQTTHEGFIFEKCVAPVAAADAAMHLGFKPSAIEQCLNTVRADLRNSPMVQPLTAGIREKINRITVVIPGTPQPFDTNSGGAMLGGSEEAVVYLTRELARLGRNVRVFTPLPATTLPGVDPHGVDWQDLSAFRHHDEHGHLVVWRSGQFAFDLLRRIAKIANDQQAGVEGVVPFTGITGSSFWLHDRAMGLPPDAGFAICKAFDSVIVLSEHHRRCIIAELGGKDPGNIVTLSNGIVPEQFEGLAENPNRDPHRVVYSSCPSRGLRVLLDMWPRVKNAVPEAKLDIYYDWSMLRDMQPELYADVMAKYEAVKHLGVVHHGGVGHAELNTALSGANVLAYSHFENTDVETFAITVVKAQAAGAEVITTKHGALPETVLNGDLIDSPAEFEDALVTSLLEPMSQEYRTESAQAVERFGWPTVAKRFSAVWSIRYANSKETLDVHVPAHMLGT